MSITPLPTRPLAIEMRGLMRRIGEIDAVDGLTCDTPLGGVVGGVGPNGSGTSTTPRVPLGPAVSRAVFQRRGVTA